MNLFCKMFYIHLSIILSCLTLGMTQDQDTDSPIINGTAKEELMGRSILPAWPKHGHGLHLLPPKHGISVGVGPFGARARHVSHSLPVHENQQTATTTATAAVTMPSWISVNNEKQPIKLENALISSDNESIKRFARQNPGLIQDLITQFQRTNEQLAQHWAPTFDTLQQPAPILYQMPLLGQALGQSILGSADSLFDLFTRSASEEEKEEKTYTTPTIIQQKEAAEKQRHWEKESNPSLLQALFDSKFFQEMQRLSENPSQLTQPFNRNFLYGRTNKNYMEAASSDISEIKVQPNNILKRTLVFKKADKNLKDLKKIVPQWFNLPKSPTKDIKTFLNTNREMHVSSNDNEMQKKLVALERQLQAELKQLQTIVKLANEMKLQTGRNDDGLVLHKIPMQKITIEDIENAIKDPDVMNILKALSQYHQTMPQKRETSINTKDNTANTLNYAVPLYNHYTPNDKNVKNSHQPMPTLELEKQIAESSYVRERNQTPVLQCHLTGTKIPEATNSMVQTTNPSSEDTMNNNERKIYYSNVGLPRFSQNNLKNYPTYPLYKAEGQLGQMSVTDLWNNSDFKAWLLSEARHLIDEMALHNATSIPTQNNTKSAKALKVETIPDTTPTLIYTLSSDSSIMQMDELVPSLNKTGPNNNGKISDSNIPIEMRLAIPQMPQNTDKQKGNLFGIIPHTLNQNIMAQQNLQQNRQEYPKNSLESWSMDPKLRTFHTQPPTVINYYYNIPNKGISSQAMPTEDLIKTQQYNNPTNNYPLSYQSNPLITAQQNLESSMEQNNAFEQKYNPATTSTTSAATSLYGLNFYGLNNNPLQQQPLQVAIGDDQILEMLRQHQTLPVTFL